MDLQDNLMENNVPEMQSEMEHHDNMIHESNMMLMSMPTMSGYKSKKILLILLVVIILFSIYYFMGRRKIVSFSDAMSLNSGSPLRTEVPITETPSSI